MEVRYWLAWLYIKLFAFLTAVSNSLFCFCSIGQSQRSTLGAEKMVPGPGAYTVPDKSIEGPKYHIGLKTSLSVANLSSKGMPGPG